MLLGIFLHQSGRYRLAYRIPLHLSTRVSRVLSIREWYSYRDLGVGRPWRSPKIHQDISIPNREWNKRESVWAYKGLHWGGCRLVADGFIDWQCGGRRVGFVNSATISVYYITYRRPQVSWSWVKRPFLIDRVGSSPDPISFPIVRTKFAVTEIII